MGVIFFCYNAFIMEEILQIKKQAEIALAAARSRGELEKLEARFLGRQGEVNRLLEKISELTAAERKIWGEQVNQLKDEISLWFSQHRQRLKQVEYQKLAEAEWIDITTPGRQPPAGHQHLVSQAIREIIHLFRRIGFTRVRHPEVDWDWYVFEALNMPKDHPARDEWETFFIEAPVDPKKGRMVLTPHTSNSQVREMEKGQRPIRMINISRCYRRQIDVSHLPMFHQFEGLMIDKNVAITHLKGVLDYFVRGFFGPDRRTRLRPFHFRFTEPSFEVDIACGVCLGAGCRLCKSGWVELAGAGLVHPRVLRAGGFDPAKWSGLAFGFGIERTMMMKAGLQLDDIRILYKNDLRFLRQF